MRFSTAWHRIVAWALFAALTSPAPGWSQAWVATGDPALRRLVERLVDADVIALPVFAWPIPRRDLESAIEAAHQRKDLPPAAMAALA
ncbi:MAG: hypothetical protein EBR15_06015, partial [Gammaproteobacteria bacterium]|nr:hypothetical protein [Gammaproteobacteria bacterium]